MGKKSKTKGIIYEREIAHELTELGYDCQRTAQHCGKPTTATGAADASDVIGLPGIHIECKRYANRGFDYDWLKQAMRDCGDNLPAVFHRIDREETVVTMSLKDWEKLYRVYRNTILKKQKKKPGRNP